MVKNSTAMSRAPGTCMMDGALYESKTMSAYARSCTTRMSCWRAGATPRAQNAPSPPAAGREPAHEECQGRAVRGRVRREADHQHLRLGDQFADRALELGDEVDAG